MNSRDLNLMVGVGLQLGKKGSDTQYLVELLGYRVGEGIIISAPQETDERLAVKEGDEVTVRYLGGVSHYAFRSQVIHISHEPYLHIHLAYPGGIEATMTRRAARVALKQQAIRLAINDQGKNISVAMEDISHGGARLVASQLLGSEGEHFSIDMPTQAPDRETMLTLGCVVRHVREEQGDGESIYHHGIEFQNMDATASTFISRFIRQNMDVAI